MRSSQGPNPHALSYSFVDQGLGSKVVQWLWHSCLSVSMLCHWNAQPQEIPWFTSERCGFSDCCFYNGAVIPSCLHVAGHLQHVIKWITLEDLQEAFTFTLKCPLVLLENSSVVNNIGQLLPLEAPHEWLPSGFWKVDVRAALTS